MESAKPVRLSNILSATRAMSLFNEWKNEKALSDFNTLAGIGQTSQTVEYVWLEAARGAMSLVNEYKVEKALIDLNMFRGIGQTRQIVEYFERRRSDEFDQRIKNWESHRRIECSGWNRPNQPDCWTCLIGSRPRSDERCQRIKIEQALDDLNILNGIGQTS